MSKEQAQQHAAGTKSKFFRVAIEGATTDGRAIQREWIDQMAATFNPQTYGARVWLEHFRGIAPDGLFRAYGDVTALEARTEADGKRALYAQITPLPDLIEMNKKGQKIYTSVEIAPDFARTGKAYLMGLAVTDSPASLGTEVLSFAAQNPAASPFAGRKTEPGNLFSAAAETALEFEQPAPAAPAGDGFSAGILATLAAMFAAKPVADKPAEPAPAAAPATQPIVQHSAPGPTEAQMQTLLGLFKQVTDKAAADVSALTAEVKELKAQIAATPATGYTARPLSTGAAAHDQTDC